MPRGRRAAQPAALSSASEAEQDELAIMASVTPRSSFTQTGWRAINEDDESPSLPIVEVTVEPPVIEDSFEYKEIPGENVVSKILKKLRNSKGEVLFKTSFKDGHIEKISTQVLQTIENGEKALKKFRNTRSPSESSSSADKMAPVTRSSLNRTRAPQPKGYKSWATIKIDGSDSDDSDRSIPPRRKAKKSNLFLDDSSSASVNIPDLVATEDDSEGDHVSNEDSDGSLDDDSEDAGPRRGLRTRKARKQKRVQFQKVGKRGSRASMRIARTGRTAQDYDEDESSEEELDYHILKSDLAIGQRKRKRGGAQNWPSRRSTRQRQDVDMREVEENRIYRSDSDENQRVPKASGAREIFKSLPLGNPFRNRHMPVCDVCRGLAHNLGVMVYCQGCSLAYHKSCLGPRGPREHLVTKVGEEDFVLQCRRCVNVARRRDPTAPDQSRCQECKNPGNSCIPFRDRKTPAQEQREREENGGVDPITDVASFRLNNTQNPLFRCISCWCAWHFEHLPSRHEWDSSYGNDEDRAESCFKTYSVDWKCFECFRVGEKKFGTIVAWRPTDAESYAPSVPVEYIEEDEKEYLIKFDGYSYFQTQWMSGPWVWGFASHTSRKAFFKKEPRPIMTTEDAIPEEYLRIDIVLDVKYTNVIDIRTDEIDRARIREVATALIKYKGLGYEDAVWEKVPQPDDGDRWTDFVTAYNDWVLGRYTHIPKGAPMKVRLEKARAEPFKKLERTKQPDPLTGGELMDYQLEGLNWIYYQWHSRRNGILADEMGLGKTIQIIAFMAMMTQEHNCFPFLAVVPNSTCPNWRREIKQWAPSLRVVTYYGSSAARQMAYDYELYPEKNKDLHCHVVVTSYEAVVDDSSRRFLKSVQWQALIVDEGQRLKNDQSLIHGALSSLKIPFRLLLTGTPLQNNARELFNLLQFLDDSIDAAQMEEEYTDMTKENILKLHDLIRPYILRRTKAQVLTFLPPMAQIIVPVSMSVLQKKLYKSIMAKNPELLRALFSSQAVKNGDRGSLNNILMQLRKCLCHPFVYSQEIEERNLQASVLHRNLVEASSKLQLLELLLPKLQERGHRVLIFSQFLDMLDIVEDFLDGLQMSYQRLDGRVNSLEKQKRIDEFNAPNSPLFAFLLSTRAGGVGINLATADTVIILDPDFNPHQDIQALSRAHRIGQTKKVLCFQLMTRASAEEKIVQIGRKKMALDHVVVDQLDAEDLANKDVESILRHGASELFNDKGEENDIRYDDASIDKLLDRSQMENTKSGADDSAESQFSFARVWANDQEKLEDALDSHLEDDIVPDPGLWEKILKERERAAAVEAAARAQVLGRGRRARVAVNYDLEGHQLSKEDLDNIVGAAESPVAASPVVVRSRKQQMNDSDTDFRAMSSDESDRETDHGEVENALFGDILGTPNRAAQQTPAVSGGERPTKQPASTTPAGYGPSPNFDQTSAQSINMDMDQGRRMVQARALPKQIAEAVWKRAVVDRTVCKPKDDEPFLTVSGEKVPAAWDSNLGAMAPKFPFCQPCGSSHPTGSCPLKVAGVEVCPLCNVAHFGVARQCPHIRSETMVRLMLEQLKNSPEDRQLVDAAAKYLRGVKGHLVQSKKRAREGLAKGVPTPHQNNPPETLQYNGQQAAGLSGMSRYTNGYSQAQQQSTGNASLQNGHSAGPQSKDLDVEERLRQALL